MAAPKVEALYAALSEGKWPQILSAAEAVLTSVPEHPAARQARSRAWQQIAAIGPAAARWPQRAARARTGIPADRAERPNPTPSLLSRNRTRTGRRHRLAERRIESRAGLRIPGAGCRSECVGRGRCLRSRSGRIACLLRPGRWRESRPPVPKADSCSGSMPSEAISFAWTIAFCSAGPARTAMRIFRSWATCRGTTPRSCATAKATCSQAHHASFINGKPVVDQAVLHDGDVIRLGSTVELEFRQPSPVSATARLSIVSRHRLPLAVDGVLLMAETCIVGSESQAHIPAPALKNPVVLYRQAGALWCRAIGAFDVDGRTCASRAPLTLQSSVLGDGFSFSLEPLGNQSV